MSISDNKSYYDTIAKYETEAHMKKLQNVQLSIPQCGKVKFSSISTLCRIVDYPKK